MTARCALCNSSSLDEQDMEYARGNGLIRIAAEEKR